MFATFRVIAYGSADYAEECRLRDSVLRQPLGLSLADEDLRGEIHQFHYGWFGEDGMLIACVIAVPLDGERMKLRQMAVDAAFSRQGHGASLLGRVEAELSKRGCSRIELHARQSAVPFYRACGYVERGDGFMEVGIPHVLMEKQIAPATDERPPYCELP